MRLNTKINEEVSETSFLHIVLGGEFYERDGSDVN